MYDTKKCPEGKESSSRYFLLNSLTGSVGERGQAVLQPLWNTLMRYTTYFFTLLCVILLV